MSDYNNRSASISLQSYQSTALKPLIVLLAVCSSFLVVAFFLQLLGLGTWAGLFGAMFVIFSITIVFGAVLMWVLGKVGY